MPTYRQSSQNAGQVAKPRTLYDSVEQRRSQPCFVEKPERTFAVHALNAVFLGFPVNEPDLISRSSHLAEYTIVTIGCSSPEFRHFAELPHVQSLNPLAPSAADVFLQLGADSLFYRHGEARLFGCYRNGELVGRAVASVDNRFPDPDVGHFGYFETCPEWACAKKLMQACEEWLREKGKKRIEGPINLNMLAGYRVQTAGFDTPAFPGEPRNPEYYPGLLDSLGYRKVALWQSWDISPLAMLGLHTIDWLQRSKRRASIDNGYRIEALRPDCLEEETQKIHCLVHEIFADNYGFSAIDLAEHVQMQGAAMDGSVKARGAFLYHSSQREPVGFSYGFNIDRIAILHTFGVIREHRGTGGADLLFSFGLAEIRSLGVRRAIGALAKEGKSKYERIGRPARAYEIVGKDL